MPDSIYFCVKFLYLEHFVQFLLYVRDFCKIKCWESQALRCRLDVEVCCSLSGQVGRLQPLLSTKRLLMAPRPDLSFVFVFPPAHSLYYTTTIIIFFLFLLSSSSSSFLLLLPPLLCTIITTNHGFFSKPP